jgi:N6-adenosine-specific RNA methylase IME4
MRRFTTLPYIYNPNMLYNLIYIDPPWFYNSKNTGERMTAGASHKYPCMKLSELKELSIPSAEASIMAMWVTVPMLRDGLILLRHYGYEYKTMLTWVKTGRLGMGWWVRINTEHLLIGLKGKVSPAKLSDRNHHLVEDEYSTLYQNPTVHSKKPQHFRDLIYRFGKACFKQDLKALEMFAREQHPGWDVFGNEVDNSIII